MNDPRHNPQAWIAKAEEDLDAVRVLAESGRSLDGVCGFHCQQAAEKYLKAVLVCEKIEPPRIHDLSRLLALIAERTGTDVEHMITDAAWLTALAVETRYPDWAAGVVVKGMTERAVAIAEQIRTFCLQRISR